MIPRQLLLFVAVLFSQPCFSQEYNYVRYDTRDGLAGSTVYDMCQDNDGFMWFATENGVSRFDGSRFTNFTVKEGLPDNEILRLFADSKGRVWFGSFGNELSFYYRGKIHNKANDSLLSNSDLQLNALNITEDKYGNMFISDYKKLIKIAKTNSVHVLTDSADFKIRLNKSVYINTDIYDNPVIVTIKDSVFRLEGSSLKFYFISKIVGENLIGTKILPDGTPKYIKSPGTMLSETIKGPTNLYISTTNGAWSLDTINLKLNEHFLPGKQISKTFIDAENNIWFSTLGEGIFKLPSREMKTFHFDNILPGKSLEVYSIGNKNQTMVAGLGFSRLALINDYKVQGLVDFSAELKKSINALATNRLYQVHSGKDGNLYLGFDGFIAKWDGETVITNNIISIKSISEVDEQHLLVSNYAFACIVRKKDLSIVDTIRHGRCTDALYHNDVYYFGTLDGLVSLDAKKQITDWGKRYPELNRRIVKIEKGEGGNLYIATADKGLVIFNNDKVVHTLNEQNGISSNICRSLFVDKDFIWLGTNKGINKIQIDHPTTIVKYSTADGLPSDVINAIYGKDSLIWVATPEGLTYFNENKIGSVSACKLMILQITHNGKVAEQSPVEMPYEDNKINFRFTAISQKSSGGVEYYYKLDGIDTGYAKTINPEVTFLSLPPGNYHLSLFAINKFGKKSGVFEYSFIVATPFWKNWWFYLLAIIIVALFTAYFILQYNKRVRNKIEERNFLQRQLASLEQLALQAQMNPHFIFNCLNSIQQFMLTNDQKQANDYLSGFAKLIDQTIDISSQPKIPIETEVEYLNNYLEMEKMRFGNNFSYNISLDPALRGKGIQIPSLLIQPYVENSVRHGLRYKQEEAGEVQIKFVQHGKVIYCHVIDNGIGRQKSLELKAARHIEYQSKGMQLTAKRIRLINLIEGKEMETIVLDHVDENENPTGTEVIVKIPIS